MVAALSSGASPDAAYSAASSAVAAQSALLSQQSVPVSTGGALAEQMAGGAGVQQAMAASGLDLSAASPASDALGQALASGQSPEEALSTAVAATKVYDATLQAQTVPSTPEQIAATAMAEGQAPPAEEACALFAQACGVTAAAKQFEAQAAVELPPSGVMLEDLSVGALTAFDLTQAAGDADPKRFSQDASDALRDGVSLPLAFRQASDRAVAARRAASAASIGGGAAQEAMVLLASGQFTPDNPRLRTLVAPTEPAQFIRIVTAGLANGENVDRAIADALAASVSSASDATALASSNQSNGG